MSVFAIRGYGIRCEDIKDNIVPEKVFSLLKESVGKDSEEKMRCLSALEDEYKNTNNFDINEIVDYFCTNYCHLAELFAVADETGNLSTDNNSDAGNSYLFCPAVLPWEASEQHFKTEEDVNDAIIAAVQKLTDLSAEEILHHIDDVYDGGYC